MSKFFCEKRIKVNCWKKRSRKCSLNLTQWHPFYVWLAWYRDLFSIIIIKFFYFAWNRIFVWSKILNFCFGILFIRYICSLLSDTRIDNTQMANISESKLFVFFIKFCVFFDILWRNDMFYQDNFYFLSTLLIKVMKFWKII